VVKVHLIEPLEPSIHQHLGVSIRQHTSAYVSIRQHTSACVSQSAFDRTPRTSESFRLVSICTFVPVKQENSASNEFDRTPRTLIKPS
jgi:hypothetical protein